MKILRIKQKVSPMSTRTLGPRGLILPELKSPLGAQSSSLKNSVNTSINSKIEEKI